MVSHINLVNTSLEPDTETAGTKEEILSSLDPFGSPVEHPGFLTLPTKTSEIQPSGVWGLLEMSVHLLRCSFCLIHKASLLINESRD